MDLSDPSWDSFVDCIVYRDERVLLYHAFDAGELLVIKHRDDGRADPNGKRAEASVWTGSPNLSAIYPVDQRSPAWELWSGLLPHTD